MSPRPAVWWYCQSVQSVTRDAHPHEACDRIELQPHAKLLHRRVARQLRVLPHDVQDHVLAHLGSQSGDFKGRAGCQASKGLPGRKADADCYYVKAYRNRPAHPAGRAGPIG